MIDLTHEQQAIVDADLDGPYLVDAGAGTGKTFTLVQRAVALVRRGTLRPDQLLVLTFTKAAATEIALRLDAELDPRLQQRPTCGTFHGIAGDVLREFAVATGISPDLRVIDDGRARGVFARAFKDLVLGRLDVELADFPLLERPDALERSLVRMVLDLKNRGVAGAAWLERARQATSELESLSFGAVDQRGKKGGSLTGWPRPDPPRQPEERAVEAARERANIAVVEALFGHFQRLLDAENLFTFGDVLWHATHMLRTHPGIAAQLGRRWRHAIVDEFQDSNAGQIAFLEAIFGDNLAPVLVVGDVRQAIYEFNGAEPQGIIDFRARARQQFALTVNRRSLQPILDVAHQSLATLSRLPPELNTPLGAQRGDGDPARCVRLEIFDDADALEREAACIAATVRDLVDSGVAPSQCAILLRTRRRASVFAQAIRDRGLAVQLHGGVGFFDAPEIREVSAWLRLAVDPADPFAVLAALQSASIGLGDGVAALLSRHGDLPRAALLDALPAELDRDERHRIDRFRRTARIVGALADAPLVDAVRSIIRASGAELARAADLATLAQVRANLEKLVRFAADFAGDRPLARIEELVAELRERDELELDLPVAEVDGERVAIMTIHGAKGLEWDHVFVVDVVSLSFPLVNNDQRDLVARFDPQSGALALKHAVDRRLTLRWFLTQHPHDAQGIVRVDPEVDYEEEFRLLYVALTRARNVLYVTGRRRGKHRASRCFEAVEKWARERSGSSDAHRFARMDVIQVVPRLLPVSVDLAGRLAARLERGRQAVGTVVERRGPLSFTAMALHAQCPRRARYQYVLGLPDLGDEAVIETVGAAREAGDGRNPARSGRVVHRVLEFDAKGRMRNFDVDRIAALDEALAEEQWNPPAAERAALQRAIDAAHMRLLPLEPLAAERRFDIEIDGVGLGGFIDLIARTPDGTPVIVDYKTGRTAAEHYALQFALYEFAVRDEFARVDSWVLRVDERGAEFEPIVPSTFEKLRAAVAAARTMEYDEPRPGTHCRYCPYANDLCSAAPVPVESPTATAPVEPSTATAFADELGAPAC